MNETQKAAATLSKLAVEAKLKKYGKERLSKMMSEAGKKGAAARWGKKA